MFRAGPGARLMCYRQSVNADEQQRAVQAGRVSAAHISAAIGKAPPKKSASLYNNWREVLFFAQKLCY